MEKKVCERCSFESANNAQYCSGCGYRLSEGIEGGSSQSVPSKISKKSDTRKRVMSLLGMIMGLLLAAGLQKLLFKRPSFDNVMIEMTKEMNKSCPIMVDAETRLDNTVFLMGKTIQYNYTLVNIESEDVDTLDFKMIMEPLIINNAKTNPQMKSLREYETNINYLYKDKYGKYICIIELKAEQYSKADHSYKEL